jgi:hypothetical protein
MVDTVWKEAKMKDFRTGSLMCIVVVSLLLAAFAAHAADFKAIQRPPVSQQLPGQLGVKGASPKIATIAPYFTVSANPQQLQLEELFQNPSGKSWWLGDARVSFTVKRQAGDPSRRYNAVRLRVFGVDYHHEIWDASEFQIEFKSIQVFGESHLRNACINAMPKYDPKNPAPYYNYATTLFADVKVDARYRNAAGEFWETVATLPVGATVSCEQEMKPSK